MSKRAEELRKAIEFAKAVIAEYKENGEAVPASVYEKGIELATELAELESRK